MKIRASELFDFDEIPVYYEEGERTRKMVVEVNDMLIRKVKRIKVNKGFLSFVNPKGKEIGRLIIHNNDVIEFTKRGVYKLTR